MRSITFISLIGLVYLSTPPGAVSRCVLRQAQHIGNYLTDCRFEVNFAVTFPHDTGTSCLSYVPVSREKVACDRRDDLVARKEVLGKFRHGLRLFRGSMFRGRYIPIIRSPIRENWEYVSLQYQLL